MITDVKTLAQNALSEMIAAQPNCAVTVVANGRSAQALKDRRISTANLTNNGETGLTTSTVRCNADTIGTISKGQTITVGGVTVFALDYRMDSAGAIATIEYSEQRPR